MKATGSALVIFLLILAPTALAQIDPDPDGLGIYFDQDGTEVVTTAVTGETTTAWLLLTNPTQSGHIYSWEATVIPDEASGSAVFGFPLGAVNVAENEPGATSWHCWAFPDPETPLALTQITILAELSIFVNDNELTTHLFLAPGAYYMDSSTPPAQTVNPSSGSSDQPVAVINGDAPMRGDRTTMGAVKGLYRR